MTETTAKLSRPVVHRNQDGRLEVFVVADGHLFNKWQKAPNGDWTDSWNNLGRPWNSVDLTSVAVGSNQDGRLEVFALGKDFAIWQNWQIFPNAGWSGWKTLGRPLNGVPFSQKMVVGYNEDGRQEVFVFATDDVIYHVWQIDPNGAWANWDRLNGPFISGDGHREELMTEIFTVGQNRDGRQELFASDKSWHVWRFRQTSPNGPWMDSGRSGDFGRDIPYNLYLALNQNGRLELFVTLRGALNIKMQVSPNGDWPTDWGWKSYGQPSPQVAIVSLIVGRNQNEHLDVFALGSDDALWRIGKDSNESWSGWESLGSPVGGLRRIPVGTGPLGAIEPPSVANNQDGRQEVFALANDNAVWHIRQTAPNNGWDDWRSLGTPKP